METEKDKTKHQAKNGMWVDVWISDKCSRFFFPRRFTMKSAILHQIFNSNSVKSQRDSLISYTYLSRMSKSIIITSKNKTQIAIFWGIVHNDYDYETQE